MTLMANWKKKIDWCKYHEKNEWMNDNSPTSFHIIQILTGMVMKYHVSVDCQESYIFPTLGLYFPQSAQHWGKYYPEGKYNYLGTTDMWYFIRPGKNILDGQNEWFPQNCMCSTTTTKFGNKIRSLRTKQTWTQTWQLARVLLWRSIVNHCILCVCGASLSGSVS